MVSGEGSKRASVHYVEVTFKFPAVLSLNINNTFVWARKCIIMSNKQREIKIKLKVKICFISVQNRQLYNIFGDSKKPDLQNTIRF